MIGDVWLTLRQAQEALQHGRLEEAQRLLGQSEAQGHRRSWEMLQQLAREFVERGRRHLKQNDPEAAWADLLRAEQVGTAETEAAGLRQQLTEPALAEVRGRLDAGQPAKALEVAALLRERFVRQPELQTLEETARDWGQAQEQADRGDFTPAAATVARLQRTQHKVPALDRFALELEQRRQSFAKVLLKLQEALSEGHWRNVIQAADQVLEVAPYHGEARKARVRAWQAIEPSTVGVRHKVIEEAAAKAAPEPPNRFLLWIDGVGGYLVCFGNRVTIGQATPEAHVDVPLFADVSRQHATLTRDTEGYLLEAARAVAVNGKPTERALLKNNDRVTLGASCQLQFRQPVPVSATARLDLTSGHRLALSVEAVVLMAETLVLGAGSQAHVTIPDLVQPVILFRQKGSLGVRHGRKFTVDGQPCQERGTLGPASVVTGDEFTFAVEPVGTRMGRT